MCGKCFDALWCSEVHNVQYQESHEESLAIVDYSYIYMMENFIW